MTNIRKTLLSLISIGVVSLVGVFASQAFFSDTETSAGNILQAGSLDLKIDSEAHYLDMVCAFDDGEDQRFEWTDNNGDDPNIRPELLGTACVGTWELKDLEEGDRFFDLTDIKPGDNGENTISIHVFDNDAWGRIKLFNIIDRDNGCTEPELEAEPNCEDDDDGELDDVIRFTAWIDDGRIPGFQCADPDLPEDEQGARCEEDPLEGDNIHQQRFRDENTELPGEVELDLVFEEVDEGVLAALLLPAIQKARERGCTESPVDGHTDYESCHGLSRDGRLVGSATYYFGIRWGIRPNVGNEIQTDSLGADISFEIEQHRNNPLPFSP